MLSTQLQTTSAKASTAPPEPRLVRAAHEFEAQLMKELLKPLTSIDDAEESGSASALGEYAGEALGRTLSDQGGFGIAARLIDQFSQSGNRPASAPVTANGHFNNGPKSAR